MYTYYCVRARSRAGIACLCRCTAQPRRHVLRAIFAATTRHRSASNAINSCAPQQQQQPQLQCSCTARIRRDNATRDRKTDPSSSSFWSPGRDAGSTPIRWSTVDHRYNATALTASSARTHISQQRLINAPPAAEHAASQVRVYAVETVS